MAKGVKAPDPYQTAAAQTASNKETAGYQQSLNMVNQNTPYGSLSYSQDGTYANGAPKYTATTTLTPEQQSLLTKGNQISQNLADIGINQSGAIGDMMSKPFSLDDASQSKYEALARTRLDPQWQQQGQQFESELLNRGVTPGSEAYNTLMNQFNQSKNDAYNSLYVSGKQLYDQEALTERNQPINEISALLGGSQVSQPNFVNTPQTQVAGTDVAGLVNQNYQNQLASSNATMGGLFGLAGTLGSAGVKGLMSFSDRRVKADIHRIGARPDGLGLYSWRYVWGGPEQTGVMADEVETLYPHAVHMVSGLKVVDYGAL